MEFSTVNVQVISGSGSTSGTVNGEGNLIVGYAENSYTYGRTGSNNLVVGPDNGWSGYGELVGGHDNQASGADAATFGVGKTNGVSPAGLVSSVTVSVGFSLGANACAGFTVGDGSLQPGDVPLFAYTTTPPTGNVLFTPGAVLTAGQAKYTACNDTSSSTTFSGSIHLVAFRG